MSREINLDEFWNKRYPHGKLPKYAKDIIIEYSNELLELAAENADTYALGNGYVLVDKQSILNTIIQIK